MFCLESTFTVVKYNSHSNAISKWVLVLFFSDRTVFSFICNIKSFTVATQNDPASKLNTYVVNLLSLEAVMLIYYTINFNYMIVLCFLCLCLISASYFILSAVLYQSFIQLSNRLQ
jgi:hypothetical protein